MNNDLIRLDARLGALELLIRNLYAQRFVGQSDPLESAEKAAREIERLSRRIKVKGSEPAVNDLLASEAEEFLVAMFREIVEIVRETSKSPSALDDDCDNLSGPSEKAIEWPPFQRPSPKLRRTG